MVSSPRLSVALCTFNGERFLSEQLQTILKQSHPPDELIAFDDDSSDRTMQILETFARSAPFAVRVHRNEIRLGPAQNFAAAIAACTGEIISLCDQDDLWEINKIEKTLEAFQSEPKPAFVFSDAEMCDEDGKSLGYRLWRSVGFSGYSQRVFDTGCSFKVLLRQNIVTGATLSFASEYRSVILPIAPGWMHDGWIALLLSTVAPCVAIDQPLIRYRQHAGQSIGAERRSLYQQYLNAREMDRTVFTKLADEYESALARLQEQSDFQIPPAIIQQLQQKIQHCRRRSAIRQREIGRIIPSIVELVTLRYSRFSLGWKSFAQDLFL